LLLQKIKHGLQGRWKRSAIRSRLATLQVAWRWHTGCKRRPHTLAGTLIVSLTSYPPRFRSLALTLRSLLRQTVKADHTILWIARDDLPLLPKNVTNLQASGLEIHATEDLRSYKKIIPALDAFPDTFICTADDDVYYWPTWLEELAKGVNSGKRIASCHRAHEITLSVHGKYKPYAEWIFDTPFRGISSNLFPTGIGGILYPPGALIHDPFDREIISSLCPNNDDVWLYWMARRKGIAYTTVGHHRDFITWEGSQKQALWHSNLQQGGNDTYIRNMAERYGYPTI
jgi:hypothetical protein